MRVLLLTIIYLFSSASSTDIKASARELMLEGSRGKAYELLINGLSAKNSKPKNQEIEKELNNLSNIFMSEKSQKYFQQSKTLFYSSDKNYISKIEKAEELEPENLKIIFTKAWFLLIEKQCSKAKTELSKIKKLNAKYGDLAAVEHYTNLCEGKAGLHCDSMDYRADESLRSKIFRFVACRSGKESAEQFKNYCNLLKIDAPKLPEVDLWCSRAVNKAVVYKNKCKSLEKIKNKRSLLEAYPFLCNKKISSKVIDD